MNKNGLIKIGKPTSRSKRKIHKKDTKTIWIIFGLIAFLILALFYNLIIKDLPDVDLINNPPKLSTKIYDRNGNLLYSFYKDENRSWVPLEKIPKSLIWATIAIEDKEFYNHNGISAKGIIQALWHNLRKSGLRGGSTITQQLVKNTFLTNEKTWTRKIREAILSLEVETKLNKDEILERYFNQVPYGGEIYGAQEASQKFFGKNIWEITMAEAAYLAGLPAAPTNLSPYNGQSNLAKKRQELVLDQMKAAGYITEQQSERIKNEPIFLKPDNIKIKSPHFVFFIKEQLEKKYGSENIGRMGLSVYTSLDPKIQAVAEKIVEEETAKVKKMRINNGAALVLNPKSGEILAMVGSKDYYSKEIDGKFNVTTALRQPGSSIKPINYLLALSRGKTLLDTIDDNPITYFIKGQKPYTPRNYNGKYMGRVTLKTALASSLNIPSVKLLNENGINNMIDLGQRMGITTWQDRDRFGLSLALGAGEIKMTELASAYSIFANLGEKTELNAILEIKNYKGETELVASKRKETVIDPGLAFLINSALSDNQARTPVFGPNSKLIVPGKTVAVKTGTTNNLRDNWCIGWTPSILVAAWVGNNDNTPMSWVASGVSGATPIWQRLMIELLKEKPDERWPIPDNIVEKKECGKNEFFIRGTENDKRCQPTSTVTGQEPINPFNYWSNLR